MKVKGIILDEQDLELIRKNGFIDFRESDGEIDSRDFERYERWLNTISGEMDAFSSEYMSGQDDAKVFYFSDKQAVIDKIASLFPACNLIEVEAEDYPLDYDYTRDKGSRPWLSL